MCLIDLEGGYDFHTPKSVGREESKAWVLSVLPHFSPPLFLHGVIIFHAHSRFTCSTIPKEKWGTTRSLPLKCLLMVSKVSAVCLRV